MNRLPTELFTNIINLLPFEQKVKCLTVNEQWHAIIYNQCLFHTLDVEFDNGLNSFLRLYPAISNREYGQQTKRLSFRAIDFPEHILLDLAEVFPNVEEVAFHDCEYGKIRLCNLWSFDFSRWKSLKSLISDATFFCEYILSTADLYNLTTLVIYGDDSVGEDLLQCLASAPNLQRITLSGVSMNLFELYTLNVSCPSIEKIFLSNVEIVDDLDMEINTSSKESFLRVDGEDYSLNSKANKLRKITILTTNYEPQCLSLWIRYCGLMYPSLVQFCLPTSFGYDLFEDSLAFAVSRWPALKFLTIGFVSRLDTLLAAMDMNKSKLNMISLSYKVDTFVECLYSLSLSKQSKCIERLGLSQINNNDPSLSTDRLSIPHLQQSLNEFTCLTYIDLYGDPVRSPSWMILLQYAPPNLRDIDMAFLDPRIDDTVAIKAAQQSPLKSFTILFEAKEGLALGDYNKAIETLLLLCPNTETVDFSGEYSCDTDDDQHLTFDLGKMKKLKNIEMHIENSRYYILEKHNGVHRAKWLDHQNRLEQDLDKKGVIAYINYSERQKLTIHTYEEDDTEIDQ